MEERASCRLAGGGVLGTEAKSEGRENGGKGENKAGGSRGRGREEVGGGWEPEGEGRGGKNRRGGGGGGKEEIRDRRISGGGVGRGWDGKKRGVE